MSVVFSNSLSCSRCGEEEQNSLASERAFHIITSNITPSVRKYISSKYDGRLCIPCLRQMIRMYKIEQGLYNQSAG